VRQVGIPKLLSDCGGVNEKGSQKQRSVIGAVSYKLPIE
jgi:hypothetical protein